MTLKTAYPFFEGTGSRGSQLEEIDYYDALQPINAATTKHIGLQWKEALQEISRHPANVLEIGAGTGVLTAGLLDHTELRSLIATDVSRKFMLAIAARSSTRPAF